MEAIQFESHTYTHIQELSMVFGVSWQAIFVEDLHVLATKTCKELKIVSPQLRADSFALVL